MSSNGNGNGTGKHANQSGLAISALRRRLTMTQEEFAHAIGVTVSTVNRWENGHIEPSRLARRAMEGLAAQRSVALDAFREADAGNEIA